MLRRPAALLLLALAPGRSGAMTRLPPIKLSLFPGSAANPTGKGAGSVSEEDIPGLWRIHDRLAAREASESIAEAETLECGITAEKGDRLSADKSGDFSASVVLVPGGSVLRTTASTFASGWWSFLKTPGSLPALEVVLDSKPDAQRLIYRGLIMVEGKQAEQQSSASAPAGPAGGERLRGMPPQLSVYGQVDHLSAMPLPEGDSDADARLQVETAATLAGGFTMKKVQVRGMGAPTFVCEVGPSRGLR